MTINLCNVYGYFYSFRYKNYLGKLKYNLLIIIDIGILTKVSSIEYQCSSMIYNDKFIYIRILY